MILVSSCLIGLKCRYDDKEKIDEDVVNYLKDKEYILVCPEQMGGLSTPRNPAEIVSFKPLKISNNIGVDVTHNFVEGVTQVEKIIEDKDITLAILKSKSPSCGSKEIYDGSFSRILTQGEGLLSKMIRNKKIRIINENEIGSIDE